MQAQASSEVLSDFRNRAARAPRAAEPALAMNGSAARGEPPAKPEPPLPTGLLWPLLHPTFEGRWPDGTPDHHARVEAALALFAHVPRLAEFNAQQQIDFAPAAEATFTAPSAWTRGA